MADESTNANQNEGADAPKKGGKLPLLIVAGLMLAEGVAVYVGVGILGSGPTEASASELQGLEQDDREATEEKLLISDRFQNMQSGRVWGWQAEIYLKVRKKNMPTVEKIMERDEAEIKEGVALIFRKAQDRHLREPGLETLSRQLTAYANQLFGTDRDGLPIVDRVILAKLKGTPEDL